MDQKQIILSYLRTQILGVIAIINEQGNPEAALVAVTETPDLELIFGTSNTTRKYRNLQKNPHVAVVVGHDVDERITVQYEGVATELSGNELEKYRALHIQKNPRSEKYAFKPDQRFFKITPTWIRYSNLAKKPQEEFEITFT